MKPPKKIGGTGVAYVPEDPRAYPTSVKPLAHSPALLPVFLHLGLGLMLGLYVPPYLVGWYTQAARMLGG